MRHVSSDETEKWVRIRCSGHEGVQGRRGCRQKRLKSKNVTPATSVRSTNRAQRAVLKRDLLNRR